MQTVNTAYEMKQKGQENRQRIVNAANELFYHKGFNKTSFSEVAESSGVPKGNFYYYFKSKEELLNAVIEQRIENIRAMLLEWEQQYPDPKERLLRVAQIPLHEAEEILHYGCPMGTLTAELGKTQPEQRDVATQMFTLFRDWTAQQFQALGKSEVESLGLAMHLLICNQGATLLSSVYGDKTILEQEAQRIVEWIKSL